MVQAAGAGCCNPFRAGALLVHYRSGARATIASKFVCACRPASLQGATLEAAERAHERQRSWHWMGAALGVLRRSSRPAWHGLSTVWNYKEPACSALARSFTPASLVTTAGHFCVRCLATPSSGTAQRKIRTHMAKQSIGIMRSELCAADSSTAQFTFEEERRVSV